MSLRSIQQLPSDLQLIARKDADADIDDASIALFNANLKEATTSIPKSEVLKMIPKADSSTSVNSLLVHAGRLKAVWEDFEAK